MEIRIEHGVVIGAEDELFLADGHQVLDLITGRKSVPEASFQNFRDNIDARTRLAAEAGARYVHLIAPDKHSVYRDRFPIKDLVILADLYRERTGADFLFPVQRLRDVTAGPAYDRTDTHWSLFGRIAVVEEIVLALGLPADLVTHRCNRLRELVRASGRNIVGDLGGRFNPPRTSPEYILKQNWPVHSFSNRVSAGNQGQVRLLVSGHPRVKGRLVIFGDSFLAQTLPLFTYFFRDVLFGRTPFYHREIVLGAAPDYVVTQNVERYLSGVDSDRNAVPLLLMSPLQGRSVTYEERDGAAIGAVLSGRGRAYAKLMAELGINRR